MRKSIFELYAFLIAGTVAGFTFLVNSNIQEVLRVDRFEHFTLSALLFLGVYFFFQAPLSLRLLVAFIASFSVGLFKELSDPAFEIFDIFANTFGICVALSLITLIALSKKNRVYFSMSSRRLR